jgi:hypothetical protein
MKFTQQGVAVLWVVLLHAAEIMSCLELLAAESVASVLRHGQCISMRCHLLVNCYGCMLQTSWYVFGCLQLSLLHVFCATVDRQCTFTQHAWGVTCLFIAMAACCMRRREASLVACSFSSVPSVLSYG